MANGVVIYRGPSMLDGAPIVCIATGLEKSSGNSKTGAMVQTWILREDMSPLASIHSGSDASICGSCAHRGTVENGRNQKRACYVEVFQAPLSVWNGYKRGIYPMAQGDEFAGLAVRVGSYGDPAAVPAEIWASMLPAAAGHTGYTHQWRRFPALAQICMASCDSAAEQVEASQLGFRTFRVRTAAETLDAREIVCPASAEGGHRTTCGNCRLCSGNKIQAKNVAIIAHGSSAKVNAFNFNRI